MRGICSRWTPLYVVILALISVLVVEHVHRPGVICPSTSRSDYKNTLLGEPADHQLCFDQPVDIVYLWVNGTDPVWLQRMRGALADILNRNLDTLPKYLVGPTSEATVRDLVNSLLAGGSISLVRGVYTPPVTDATRTPLVEGAHGHLGDLSSAPGYSVDGATASRYVEMDELRYSLRSVWLNAPWARMVYIVTDAQVPAWLADHPRIRVVDHRDFIPQAALPLFSSAALETYLHNIEGLSERFIYMNDDVLFGQPITPHDFVDADTGAQRAFLAWAVPSCTAGCQAMWLGDGFCDSSCNVKECDFDGGDCIGRNSAAASTTILNPGMEAAPCTQRCQDEMLGDGACDVSCNVAQCAYDLGDCEREGFNGVVGGVFDAATAEALGPLTAQIMGGVDTAAPLIGTGLTAATAGAVGDAVAKAGPPMGACPASGDRCGCCGGLHTPLLAANVLAAHVADDAASSRLLDAVTGVAPLREAVHLVTVGPETLTAEHAAWPLPDGWVGPSNDEPSWRLALPRTPRPCVWDMLSQTPSLRRLATHAAKGGLGVANDTAAHIIPLTAWHRDASVDLCATARPPAYGPTSVCLGARAVVAAAAATAAAEARVSALRVGTKTPPVVTIRGGSLARAAAVLGVSAAASVANGTVVHAHAEAGATHGDGVSPPADADFASWAWSRAAVAALAKGVCKSALCDGGLSESSGPVNIFTNNLALMRVLSLSLPPAPTAVAVGRWASTLASPTAAAQHNSAHRGAAAAPAAPADGADGDLDMDAFLVAAAIFDGTAAWPDAPTAPSAAAAGDAATRVPTSTAAEVSEGDTGAFLYGDTYVPPPPRPAVVAAPVCPPAGFPTGVMAVPVDPSVSAVVAILIPPGHEVVAVAHQALPLSAVPVALRFAYAPDVVAAAAAAVRSGHGDAPVCVAYSVPPAVAAAPPADRSAPALGQTSPSPSPWSPSPPPSPPTAATGSAGPHRLAPLVRTVVWRNATHDVVVAHLREGVRGVGDIRITYRAVVDDYKGLNESGNVSYMEVRAGDDDGDGVGGGEVPPCDEVPSQIRLPSRSSRVCVAAVPRCTASVIVRIHTLDNVIAAAIPAANTSARSTFNATPAAGTGRRLQTIDSVEPHNVRTAAVHHPPPPPSLAPVSDAALHSLFYGGGRTGGAHVPSKAITATHQGGTRRRLMDSFAESLRYTNDLFRRRFGSTASRAIAHMPHFLRRSVLRELAADPSLGTVFNATGRSRFRGSRDMQYAYAYFYWLLHANVSVSLEERFETTFDPDGDGLIAPREVRGVALSVARYSPPLRADAIGDVLGKVFDQLDAAAAASPSPLPPPPSRVAKARARQGHTGAAPPTASCGERPAPAALLRHVLMFHLIRHCDNPAGHPFLDAAVGDRGARVARLAHTEAPPPSTAASPGSLGGLAATTAATAALRRAMAAYQLSRAGGAAGALRGGAGVMDGWDGIPMEGVATLLPRRVERCRLAVEAVADAVAAHAGARGGAAGVRDHRARGGHVVWDGDDSDADALAAAMAGGALGVTDAVALALSRLPAARPTCGRISAAYVQSAWNVRGGRVVDDGVGSSEPPLGFVNASDAVAMALERRAIVHLRRRADALVWALLPGTGCSTLNVTLTRLVAPRWAAHLAALEEGVAAADAAAATAASRTRTSSARSVTVDALAGAPPPPTPTPHPSPAERLATQTPSSQDLVTGRHAFSRTPTPRTTPTPTRTPAAPRPVPYYPDPPVNASFVAVVRAALAVAAALAQPARAVRAPRPVAHVSPTRASDERDAPTTPTQPAETHVETHALWAPRAPACGWAASAWWVRSPYLPPPLAAVYAAAGRAARATYAAECGCMDGATATLSGGSTLDGVGGVGAPHGGSFVADDAPTLEGADADALLDQLLTKAQLAESPIGALLAGPPRRRYAARETDDAAVAFKMLTENITDTRDMLDDVVAARSKFICVNDNVEHTSPAAPVVRRMIRGALHTLFPHPSPFEVDYPGATAYRQSAPYRGEQIVPLGDAPWSPPAHSPSDDADRASPPLDAPQGGPTVPLWGYAARFSGLVERALVDVSSDVGHIAAYYEAEGGRAPVTKAKAVTVGYSDIRAAPVAAPMASARVHMTPLSVIRAAIRVAVALIVVLAVAYCALLVLRVVSPTAFAAVAVVVRTLTARARILNARVAWLARGTVHGSSARRASLFEEQAAPPRPAQRRGKARLDS